MFMIMMFMFIIVVFVIMMVVMAVLMFVIFFATMMVVAVFVFVIVFFPMMMAVLMFTVIIMMVVMAAFALFIFIVVVMRVFMFFTEFFHLNAQPVFTHGGKNLHSVQFRPRSRNQSCPIVHGFQQFRRLQDPLFPGCIGPAHDDEIRICNLIGEELAKITGIHFCFAGIDHGDFRADLRTVHAFNSRSNIRKFAHARWFNQDPVRRIIRNHLFQRFCKVADQCTADAAGVHLCNLYTGVLQKTAIDRDFTEFVFNQNQLLPGVSFLNEFADQGRFACSKKSRKNVNFRHEYVSSVMIALQYACAVIVPSPRGVFPQIPSGAFYGAFQPAGVPPDILHVPCGNESAASHKVQSPAEPSQ